MKTTIALPDLPPRAQTPPFKPFVVVLLALTPNLPRLQFLGAIHQNTVH